MKKLRYLSLFVSISMLTSITTAEAIPLYYSFEGVASPTAHNQANSLIYSNLMGVSLGDTVSYVFYVDDKMTNGTQPGGSLQNYGYTISNSVYGLRHEFSYHASLVSGTGLNINSQVPNAVFEGNLTYSNSPTSPYHETPAYSEIGLFGYGTNGSINIWLDPSNMQRSSIGTYDDVVLWLSNNPFGIHNRLSLKDSYGTDHFFDHYLKLTSISVTAPQSSVPEPSVLYLMGIGLLGVGIIRYGKLLKIS